MRGLVSGTVRQRPRAGEPAAREDPVRRRLDGLEVTAVRRELNFGRQGGRTPSGATGRGRWRRGRARCRPRRPGGPDDRECCRSGARTVPAHWQTLRSGRKPTITAPSPVRPCVRPSVRPSVSASALPARPKHSIYSANLTERTVRGRSDGNQPPRPPAHPFCDTPRPPGAPRRERRLLAAADRGPEWASHSSMPNGLPASPSAASAQHGRPPVGTPPGRRHGIGIRLRPRSARITSTLHVRHAGTGRRLPPGSPCDAV